MSYRVWLLINTLPQEIHKLSFENSQVRKQCLWSTCTSRAGGALGEAEGVKDAAGVAVLAGALEEALQAAQAARLGLAARLLEVLPPLDLHKVEREDLDRDQRVCAAAAGGRLQASLSLSMLAPAIQPHARSIVETVL